MMQKFLMDRLQKSGTDTGLNLNWLILQIKENMKLSLWEPDLPEEVRLHPLPNSATA